MKSLSVVGVDLAWVSDKNPTAIAYGELHNHQLTLCDVYENLYGVESIVQTLSSKLKPQGVAIDAPLIINNASGQRECEKQLGKAYRTKKASCHASNLQLYPNADSVSISQSLLAAGYKHAADPQQHWQVECYPHPALIEIFQLDERLLYKKGLVDDKRQGQIELARKLLLLSNSTILSLSIPSKFHQYFDADNIKGLKGINLKHNEDILDAIICMVIAALYQLGYSDKIFGNTHDGYIYVPQVKCM